MKCSILNPNVEITAWCPVFFQDDGQNKQFLIILKEAHSLWEFEFKTEAKYFVYLSAVSYKKEKKNTLFIFK